MRKNNLNNWVHKVLWQGTHKTSIFYRLLVIAFDTFMAFGMLLFVIPSELNIFIKILGSLGCIFCAYFYVPTFMTTALEKDDKSFSYLFMFMVMIMFPYFSTPIGFLYLIHSAKKEDYYKN